MTLNASIRNCNLWFSFHGILNVLPRFRSSCVNHVPRKTFRSPVSPGRGGRTEFRSAFRSENRFSRVGEVSIGWVRTALDLISQFVAQPARSVRFQIGSPEFSRKILPSCQPPIMPLTHLFVLLK